LPEIERQRCRKNCCQPLFAWRNSPPRYHQLPWSPSIGFKRLHLPLAGLLVLCPRLGLGVGAVVTPPPGEHASLDFGSPDVMTKGAAYAARVSSRRRAICLLPNRSKRPRSVSFRFFSIVLTPLHGLVVYRCCTKSSRSSEIALRYPFDIVSQFLQTAPAELPELNRARKRRCHAEYVFSIPPPA